MERQPKIVPLPKFESPEGALIGRLTVFDRAVPNFTPVRAFWMDDLYPTSRRGGHAHKLCDQFIIAVSGRCKVSTNRPRKEPVLFNMNSPTCGLFIPAGTWVDIYDCNRQTVILVLASRPYEKEDYIADPEEFQSHGQDTSK